MKGSSIQWCDNTFNPWEGCTKVAPECKNCYAETLVDRRFGRVKWGKGQLRRRTSENLWKSPLAWNKTAICLNCGYAELLGGDDCRKCFVNFAVQSRRRPRVFCLSLGDWLDDEVPIKWLADLLALIHATQNLDWLLLTKRPGNWHRSITMAIGVLSAREYVKPTAWLLEWERGNAPENIWIGVSAGADQKAALEIPAKIHFLSCEPMLHALDGDTQEFDWVIFGGESGKNARPCNIDWIRRGVEICRENGVAPFVKQLGAKPYFDAKSPPLSGPIDIELNDSHGGDMSEWPEDLRVREFPKIREAMPV